VVARGPGPGVEGIPRAEDVLRTRGIQSAWRVEIDAHVGVVVLSKRITVDRLSAQLSELATGPVGLSEVYQSLEQTPAAVRQARLSASAGRGLVGYERVPIPVLLARAPDAAAGVARAILGSVLALPRIECEILLSTLDEWFAADGATSTAADRLHVHRNTVR